MKPETEAKSSGPGPHLGGEKAKSKMGLIIVLAVAGVVVVGMAIATYLFLLKPGPDQVVKKFLAAQVTGDIEALRSTVTGADAAKLPPGGNQPKPPQQASIPDMEIGQPKIEGNRAVVPVKIKERTMGFGAQAPTLNIVLAKEGGQWKVDMQATINQMMQGMVPGGPAGETVPAPPEQGQPPAPAPPEPGGTP